jgi:hypothetical protein
MQPTVSRKIAKHVLIGTSSYPLFSICNPIAERQTLGTGGYCELPRSQRRIFGTTVTEHQSNSPNVATVSASH